MKMIYPCDPNKNINCSKTNCYYLNGGTCGHTKHSKFASDDYIKTLELYSKVEKRTINGNILDFKFTEEDRGELK